MSRRLAIALLALSLAPVSAEAAKIRVGSPSVRSPAKVDAKGGIFAPKPAKAKEGQAAAEGQRRIPFPPASAAPQPEPARLTTAEAPKPWCGTQTVVGGFCVLN